jgi:predicted lipoprotein with Yx(FWY)xxD motif
MLLSAAAISLGLAVTACPSQPTGGGQTSGPATSAAPNPPAATATVRAAPLKPGTALVDGNGRALYLFEKDTGTTSTCYDACANVWPPLLTHATPVATSGAQAALLGTTQRSDGGQQVTYHGHPLYYYVGDKNPGDTNGQGLNQFGAAWYLLTPDGNKIDTS